MAENAADCEFPQRRLGPKESRNGSFKGQCIAKGGFGCVRPALTLTGPVFPVKVYLTVDTSIVTGYTALGVYVCCSCKY